MKALPRPFGNIGGVDVVTRAYKLINMHNAIDAGGGCFRPKASQKWQREAYLYEAMVLQDLLDRIVELEAGKP